MDVATVNAFETGTNHVAPLDHVAAGCAEWLHHKSDARLSHMPDRKLGFAAPAVSGRTRRYDEYISDPCKASDLPRSSKPTAGLHG